MSLNGKIKQVIFIGGIQGSGKTSLCARLKFDIGCQVTKQRKSLIEVGQKYNLGWDDIGVRHDEFIEEAADLISFNFLKNLSNQTLLIDCHYAIRAEKALRLSGKIINEAYIQDIDQRLIEKLAQNLKLRFVLVDIHPQLAIQRFTNRPFELLDYDNTLEGLEKQRYFENVYFNRIVSDLNIKDNERLFIQNLNFEQSVLMLTKFILM